MAEAVPTRAAFHFGPISPTLIRSGEIHEDSQKDHVSSLAPPGFHPWRWAGRAAGAGVYRARIFGSESGPQGRIERRRWRRHSQGRPTLTLT